MWGECEVWVDCKYMEFVAAGCCTRKWLRFDQTIRNVTWEFACGESTGSNRIEKCQGRVSPRLL